MERRPCYIGHIQEEGECFGDREPYESAVHSAGDCFVVHTNSLSIRIRCPYESVSNMYHGDEAASQANTEYVRERGGVIRLPAKHKRTRVRG